MRSVWIVVTAALGVLPGCVSSGSKKVAAEPAPGPVCEVQSLWQGRIIKTADVVHKGAQLPGLAGRVYLFGSDLGTTMKGKGKLLVDLYDRTQVGPEGQAPLLEHYEFPNAVLTQLLRKDTIGWGYTVFLPWPEYRPDIKHVQLKVSFAPEDGTPVFAPLSQIAIRNEGPATVERVVTLNPQDADQHGAQIPMRVSVPPSAENK